MIELKKLAAAVTFALGGLSCSTGAPSVVVKHDRVATPRPEPVARVQVPKASPEVLFENARKFFENRDYNKSHDYFSASAAGWSGKPRQYEALLWANRSLVRAGRHYDVIEFTKTLIKDHPWTDAAATELHSTLFQSQLATGQALAALGTSLSAVKNPQLTKESEAYRLRTLEIIQSRLTTSELQQIAERPELGGPAYFRLGELSLEEKDSDSARRYFSKCVSLDAQTEVGQRAQAALDQLEALSRVEPKTIGVVLPMTGKHSAISQKTLRGVQMGLGLYNNLPSAFKLAVVDSEGNPDGARRGVEKLVKDDNVIAVIGSLLSKTAPAVASKASELGVPTIALSQKSGITEASPSVFRNSLTSEMQVRYLVKTAMEEMGMKKFAIVFPNDLYGTEFANIFWDEVLARGGSIVAAQSYSVKETDFRLPIQRLVGTFYLEGRSEEYRLRLREWNETQAKKNSRATPPEDLLPPIVDFDAVFIPDSVKAMGQISAMLSFNGVKGVRLLGTNLWNVPGLAKRSGHFANSLLFVDSFVVNEPRFLNSSFVKDYKLIFNEDPGIFEIQGYDSGLLLRQLISQGNNSRDSLTRALAEVNNFPGSIGPLSITPQREILRPLLALTLDSTGNIISFQKTKNP